MRRKSQTPTPREHGMGVRVGIPFIQGARRLVQPLITAAARFEINLSELLPAQRARPPAARTRIPRLVTGIPAS